MDKSHKTITTQYQYLFVCKRGTQRKAFCIMYTFESCTTFTVRWNTFNGSKILLRFLSVRQEIDSLSRVYQKLVATNRKVLTAQTTGTGPGTVTPSNGSACEVRHRKQLFLFRLHSCITYPKPGNHKFSKNLEATSKRYEPEMEHIPYWGPSILQWPVYLVFIWRSLLGAY
jgi:hypothetical protein